MATMRVTEETPTKLVLMNNLDELLMALIVFIPGVAGLIYFLYSGVLFCIIAIIGAILELLCFYGLAQGLTITFDQTLRHIVDPRIRTQNADEIGW